MSKEEIVTILKKAVQIKASDIHLVITRPPMVRTTGALHIHRSETATK